MLPTFVIGLREGLEASLIVGIIAAFLRKQGRLDLLRWVYAGIGTAVTLCVAVGIALRVLSQDLPQKQQEGLETVIGALAVGMVTYMVIWMRRHSRDLKGTLEGATADALSGGSDRAGRALVVMAFLAVLREGFETVVFLLAAFNESGSGASPVAGAIIGILVAVVLGWGIYRGGVRLNLSKFFRATGLVLVFVAAGLVMTAFHTAHEAGWLNAGQHQTIDLSWLVRPGTVRASLLTGILGLQPRPVVIELAGWLIYLVPVALYVGWPQGRRVPLRPVAWTAVATALASGVAAVILAGTAPGKPPMRPVTGIGESTLQALTAASRAVTVRMPVDGPESESANLVMRRVGMETVDGMTVDRYAVVRSSADTGDHPAALSDGEVARLSGGRLPLGLTASSKAIPVSYADATQVSVELEPQTGRIVAATWQHTLSVKAHASFGLIALPKPLSVTHAALPVATVAAAVTAARHDLSALDRREDYLDGAGWLAALATVLLALALAIGLAGRGRPTRREPTPLDGSPSGLVQHQVSLT